jgi:hypothetical protein
VTHFFVDTSALAKRYVHEIGSTWVRSWIVPKSQHTIIVSRLTSVEMISLLMRRQREQNLSALEVKRARNNFLAHLRSQYLVIETGDQVILTARRLLSKHVLRTLDALQLASALHISRELGKPIHFICADPRLLTTASVEVLPIDNPNAYP